MELTVRRAQYLYNVTIAISKGEIPAAQLYTECLECGYEIDEMELAIGGDHIFARTPQGEAVIVAGCEGYWHIDPASVGMDRDQWTASDSD